MTETSEELLAIDVLPWMASAMEQMLPHIPDVVATVTTDTEQSKKLLARVGSEMVYALMEPSDSIESDITTIDADDHRCIATTHLARFVLHTARMRAIEAHEAALTAGPNA